MVEEVMVKVPVVERSECNRRGYWNSYVDPSMLCAGNTARKVSACQVRPILLKRQSVSFTFFRDSVLDNSTNFILAAVTN